MAGAPIQPAIDAYGSRARASNLADHLELLCLSDQTLSRKGLADLISDRSWVRKMHELYEMPAAQAGGEADEEDAATGDGPGSVQANRVFNVLDERVELLGDLYPFEIGEEVALREGVDPRASPYVALLAITLAHAHGVEVEHDPTRVLEAAVVAALAERGLSAVNVAEAGRGTENFAAAVQHAAEEVGLRAMPEVVVTMVNANDEGVDALAHLPWGDLRIGAWAFIGQATCEMSDGWPAKIREPSEELWKRMLNLGVFPFAFLAVPHHVEPEQLQKLVQDEKRAVLDRIRLARYRREVSAEEAVIVEAVLALGAEPMA